MPKFQVGVSLVREEDAIVIVSVEAPDMKSAESQALGFVHHELSKKNQGAVGKASRQLEWQSSEHITSEGINREDSWGNLKHYEADINIDEHNFTEQ